MPHLPAELFHDWHDFFVLVGTASATLVGLMFVAASIGSSYFNEDHRAAMQTFLTPTVVHFVAVLMVCLLCTIPNHNWVTLSVLLGAEGIAGAIYCGSILLQFTLQHRFKVDLGDRLFYASLPALGYLMLIVTAALLMMRSTAAPDVIAAALLTLMVASLRNAWDMTLWIVIKAPTAGPPPDGGGTSP